uniref:Uncharacterized protein n=1 Tax=Arundo donax TaxID=35708 RepID=A0A0A9FCX0_ARUDO
MAQNITYILLVFFFQKEYDEVGTHLDVLLDLFLLNHRLPTVTPMQT